MLFSCRNDKSSLNRWMKSWIFKKDVCFPPPPFCMLITLHRSMYSSWHGLYKFAQNLMTHVIPAWFDSVPKSFLSNHAGITGFISIFCFLVNLWSQCQLKCMLSSNIRLSHTVFWLSIQFCEAILKHHYYLKNCDVPSSCWSRIISHIQCQHGQRYTFCSVICLKADVSAAPWSGDNWRLLFSFVFLFLSVRECVRCLLATSREE